MFQIMGVNTIWLKRPSSNCAFVYDLDDTLLSRVGKKPNLVPFDRRQKESDDVYILTFRPLEYRDRTLSDLKPVIDRLTGIFSRDTVYYPHDGVDIDIFNYKLSVLSEICKRYEEVCFFENKETVISSIAKTNIPNLKCYLVNIMNENDLEKVIKTKL